MSSGPRNRGHRGPRLAGYNAAGPAAAPQTARPPVLTLAEEIGLGGYQLSSRVRSAFMSLPESEVAALMQQVRNESARRHLVYLRDGQEEVVGLFPLPLTALP